MGQISNAYEILVVKPNGERAFGISTCKLGIIKKIIFKK